MFNKYLSSCLLYGLTMKVTNLSKDWQALLAVLAFILYSAVFIVFNIYVGNLLAGDSAAALSSYSAMNTISSFVSLFFGFLSTTCITLVGKADSQQNFEEAGRYMSWMLIAGLLCGLLATLILSLSATSLVEIFKDSKTESDDELLEDTDDGLLIIAYFFWGNILGNSVSGIFLGILHVISMVFLSFGLGILYGAISIGMYNNGYGMVSFGWATVVSKLFFAAGGVLLLFLPKYRRYKIWRIPDSNSLRTTLNETWTHFKAAFTYTGLRSVVTNSRLMINTLLAIRLSAVDGAVYRLYEVYSQISSTFSLSFSSLVLIVCARLFGNFIHDLNVAQGEPGAIVETPAVETENENTPIVQNGSVSAGEISDPAAKLAVEQKQVLETKALRGFISFSNFSARLSWIWGILVTLYFSTSGPLLIVNAANEDEKRDYEKRFEYHDFVLFLCMQLLYSLTTVYENLLIAVQDFKEVAFITVAPFIFAYFPILLYGYFYVEDVSLFFFADVVYFGCRTVMVVFYWHYIRKPQWVKRLKEKENKLNITTDRNGCCNKFTLCVFATSFTDLKTAYREVIKSWGVTKDKDIEPVIENIAVKKEEDEKESI